MLRNALGSRAHGVANALGLATAVAASSAFATGSEVSAIRPEDRAYVPQPLVDATGPGPTSAAGNSFVDNEPESPLRPYFHIGYLAGLSVLDQHAIGSFAGADVAGGVQFRNHVALSLRGSVGISGPIYLSLAPSVSYWFTQYIALGTGLSLEAGFDFRDVIGLGIPLELQFFAHPEPRRRNNLRYGFYASLRGLVNFALGSGSTASPVGGGAFLVLGFAIR